MTRPDLPDHTQTVDSLDAPVQRRPGRPFKNALERRTDRLIVLLTPSETDRLTNLANAAGMAVSQYVRHRALYPMVVLPNTEGHTTD